MPVVVTVTEAPRAVRTVRVLPLTAVIAPTASAEVGAEPQRAEKAAAWSASELSGVGVGPFLEQGAGEAFGSRVGLGPS